MSYQKQNFANGEVLTALQLNHIENGIADVESAANTTKGVVDKIIDPTLTLSGKAADAKATGDAVGELKEDIDDNYDILTKKANILTTKLEKAYIRSDGSIGSSNLHECSKCDVTNLINTNIRVITELSQTEFPYVAFYDLPLEETVWNVPKENAIEFFFPQFQGKCQQNFKVPSNTKILSL